jgi:hypothetical protein
MTESGRLAARGICGYGRFTKVRGSTRTAAFSELWLEGTTELRLVLSGDCVVSSHSASSVSSSPSSKPTDFFLPVLDSGRSVTKDFFPKPELWRRRTGVELFLFIEWFLG